jgi:hypothetical protein
VAMYVIGWVEEDAEEEAMLFDVMDLMLQQSIEGWRVTGAVPLRALCSSMPCSATVEPRMLWHAPFTESLR